MLFSTPFFLFVFLPIFFALYWFLPARRSLLLLGSTVFYAWSEPVFLLVVFASATLDWLLGRAIAARPPGTGCRKWLVGAGVASNLGLLLYVKYTAFALTNLNALLAHTAWHPLPVPQVALPLGVSFIVFEKITYVVDLYRGRAAPAASLLDYCNYVLLFPKLLAGPIIKYHDIAGQLARPSHRFEDVRDGAIRFIHGLAKKVLLADTFSTVVDQTFQLTSTAPQTLDPGTAWLGLTCFTLQIYFDFAGYSDMAIGLGRILGFRLLENFLHPYLATSFTDFWRRWHISLSSWIKEYLYIPLGGNRVSVGRGYVNLGVCFLLSGLWHGASWNFVTWGCAHGAALVADRAFWLEWQKRLPRGVNLALTLLLVMLTWVFFRCPEFSQALGYLKALAGGAQQPIRYAAQPANDVIFILLAGVGVVLAPLVTERFAAVEPAPPGRTRAGALAACCLLLYVSIGRMTVNAFHPFLYFRF